VGWLILICHEGDVELKEFECVQVHHHKDIGKTLEEWQKNGWRFNTYACTQVRIAGDVNSYLLFEKGE
jgi:hypothetical protein